MKQNPIFSFSRRMGNTTFSVNAFYAEDTAATYEAKCLELIRNDPAYRNAEKSTDIIPAA